MTGVQTCALPICFPVTIRVPTENRLIKVQQALALGASVDEVNKRSGIDPWFLTQIQEINVMAEAIRSAPDLGYDILRKAKRLGFSDQQIFVQVCNRGTATGTLDSAYFNVVKVIILVFFTVK